ncbi:MAG TPA: hypothetical protein VF821_00045 [Lentzea sp.]
MDEPGDEEREALPSVSNTVTGSVTGNVFQTGVHFGDVHVRQGEQARSRYRELVKRLAPPTLIGRSAELAALAGFCTSSSETYQYWRAPAWAGKSALMATFVLNPPSDVRIISFFVTARLAGQSDRTAFLDSTLEQLATLLERLVPAANREAHFHGMLTEAAARCAAEGSRLVLLVDGLDEDRGVTGADFHSIAALLPTDPPHGSRVIVSGRPHPPVPDDVPPEHPLRDPGIVRVLETSERAQVVALDMRRELDRLLTGSSVDRDLVGLLVASGGGLTASDLSELVADDDWPQWRIEEHLAGVAGRSFLPLAHPSGAYLLGHEELSTTAATRIGDHHLTDYRTRLHAWADTYRDRGWPAETPAYLLHAYHRVVDNERLITLVSDAARHRRMAEAFGGHHIAVTEITTAQQVLLGADPLDLSSMVLLNVHQHYLESRDEAIPRYLPIAWATLGDADRAISLARSTGFERCSTLVEVAEVLGPDEPRYAQLLDDAEKAAQVEGEYATSRLIDLFLSKCLLDRADLLVRAVVFWQNVEPELEQVATALIAAGRLDRAESLIRFVGTSELPPRSFSRPKERRTRPQVKAALLAKLVAALAQQGDLYHAQTVTTTIDDPLSRLVAIAARIDASPPDQIQKLNDEATAYLDTLQGENERLRARAGAVACIATTGDYDLALEAWRQLPTALQFELRKDLVERHPPEIGCSPALKAVSVELLSRVADKVEHDRAVQSAWTDFARIRSALLLGAHDAHLSVAVLLKECHALGMSVTTELEAVADELPEGEARDEVFAMLAAEAASMDDIPRSRSLLERTHHTASRWEWVFTSTSPDFSAVQADADALMQAVHQPLEHRAFLALSAAIAGDVDRATRLADEVENALHAEETLPLGHWLARLVEAVGDRRLASHIAEEAVATLRPSEGPLLHTYLLMHATEAIGRFDLTARVILMHDVPYIPPSRFTASAQRLRARFFVRKPARVPRPAREIAEKLLDEEWTEHIEDIALLCPGLPERIYHTIVALTGVNADKA